MCAKYCLTNTMMRKLGNFVRVYLLHIPTFSRFYNFYEVLSRNLIFTKVCNGNCPSRVLILETAGNAHCETHSHNFWINHWRNHQCMWMSLDILYRFWFVCIKYYSDYREIYKMYFQKYFAKRSIYSSLSYWYTRPPREIAGRCVSVIFLRS